MKFNPIFESNLDGTTAYVPESFDIQLPLAFVNVYDQDSGDNGKVVYNESFPKAEMHIQRWEEITGGKHRCSIRPWETHLGEFLSRNESSSLPIPERWSREN